MAGVYVAKVKQIEAATRTINPINPWIINGVEPDAAAVAVTFDVKAEALLDGIACGIAITARRATLC